MPGHKKGMFCVETLPGIKSSTFNEALGTILWYHRLHT